MPPIPVLAPIGGIVAWLKSYTNTPALPAGWVECNGQTLNDAESPYNGRVIPNLNGSSSGTKRFLRGSTTSGATGGSETHNHGLPITDLLYTCGGTLGAGYACTGTNSASTLPSYYEVVWILRVK